MRFEPYTRPGADSSTRSQTSPPGAELARVAELDARRRQLTAAQAKVAALAGERDRLKVALAKAQVAAIANAADGEPATVADALKHLRMLQRGMSMECRLAQIMEFYPHLAR